MSILGLDLGEKRVGIAVSDASASVAMPLVILPANEVVQGARSFKVILDEHEVERIIVGLPLSLDGSEHAQARRIRKQAETLEQLYGLPLEFMDERLTSAEAKRSLRQLGYSEKDMRAKTDKIAACILLQTWLDQQRQHELDEERHSGLDPGSK